MDHYQLIKKEPYPLYIDGQFVPSVSGKTEPSVHPGNNREFASYYKGGREDVLRAIDAAHRAYYEGSWREMTAAARSKLLIKVGRILERRMEEFAHTEALDCGKLYNSMVYFEGPQAVDAFNFAAAKCRHMEGKTIPVDGGGRNLNIVIRQPKGVVGEILPWNGPFMMGCQKLAIILAAGNTVILKPPTWASLSMLLLAEVFNEAGFPPGVVNFVTGSGGEIGNALVMSDKVDMIAMTGGTETGKQIIADSAATVKDIALELGGKSPNIVFDDADFEKSVDQAIMAFTLNAGQVCVAGTRLLVQDSIYPQFLKALAERLENTVKPGDIFDPSVNLQPMISSEHKETVMNYIKTGIGEGARLVTGGAEYDAPALAAGNFVQPTVFADVSPDMRIFQEEIFGPVLCVTPFKDEDEAIRLANRTVYGLAGAVFTKDLSRAIRVISRLDAGQVYINSYYSKGINESPAAGWKQSGVGVAGIDKYMHEKTVFVNYD